MASGRFDVPLQDRTAYYSEHDSLSQHPLAQATILSEEGSGSCYSQTLHNLSPSSQEKQEEMDHQLIKTVTTDNSQQTLSRGSSGNMEKDSEAFRNPRDNYLGEAGEDEMFFLSNIPAEHLLKLLQKEVGMQSSSSSHISSTSEVFMKSAASITDESKSTKVCRIATDQNMVMREGPPGEACFPQQHTRELDTVSKTGQSQTQLSEVSNISMSSHDGDEVLHKELVSEQEQHSSLETQSKHKQQNSASPSESPSQSLKEMSEAKPRVISVNIGGTLSAGPFSGGVDWVHREHLWSSGNQTGIDGSYLGFLPESQSTPGVFKAPSKSNVKPNLGKLPIIESNKENSYQSSTGIVPQQATPIPDTCLPDTENQCQEEALQASAEVQSLPSLNYMQKVDAWRANQSLGKTPLFDSLALQELSGVSSKKKADDSVSDTLNKILTQQANSSQQLPVSGAANPQVTRSSFTAPSGSSSPRRGEAVGGAPNGKDNKGPAAPPSASPLGNSQSFSSLNTVVMSVHKHQQTGMIEEKEMSQSQDDAHHQPSTTVKHVTLMDLGRFSDVSIDQDLGVSGSQDSNSGIKLGTSLGTPSIVSLELDNYAPYWTSKPSTTSPLPKSQELNIDERIPVIEKKKKTLFNIF